MDSFRVQSYVTRKHTASGEEKGDTNVAVGTAGDYGGVVGFGYWACLENIGAMATVPREEFLPRLPVEDFYAPVVGAADEALWMVGREGGSVDTPAVASKPGALQRQTWDQGRRQVTEEVGESNRCLGLNLSICEPDGWCR